MKQKTIKGVIKRKVLVVEYFQLVCCSLLLLIFLFAFAIVTDLVDTATSVGLILSRLALIISILAFIILIVAMLVGIIDSFKKEGIEEEIILNVTGGGGL